MSMEKPKLGLVDIQPYDNTLKYLTLVYNVENDFGDVVQITYPKVENPFNIETALVERYAEDAHERGLTYYHLTSDKAAIVPVGKCVSKHQIIWKKPPEEMTIKEIEAALGHPVKIVAERKEGEE